MSERLVSIGVMPVAGTIRFYKSTGSSGPVLLDDHTFSVEPMDETEIGFSTHLERK